MVSPSGDAELYKHFAQALSELGNVDELVGFEPREARVFGVLIVPFSLAGLELVDALASERTLQKYHLLPSVRGDLLAKLQRFEEARVEFERAAALTRNARERELLLERAAACTRESTLTRRERI